MYQNILSPRVRSLWSESAFSCSRSIPPWPWTMGFGRPVVPDVKSTQSGWSKGTFANSSGSLLSPSSTQSSAPATPSFSRVSVTIVVRMLGIDALTSSTTPCLSNHLPP